MDIKRAMQMLNKVNEVITSDKQYYDTVKFAGGIVDVRDELAKAWKILLITVGEVKGEEHLKLRLYQDGIVSLRKQGYNKFSVKQVFDAGLKVGIGKLDYAIKLGNEKIDKGGAK